jgi:DNA-binding GntR family transcriptional regulator
MYMTEATLPFRLPDLIAKDLARVLSDEIILGRLAPDTRLVEEEVAKRYGVSRSPVREALWLLVQDGLAVRSARRGLWVTPIGRADLDEVYSCRLALEGLAAEQAARVRTPSQIETLREAFAALERAHGEGDATAYFRANLQFTDAIHGMAQNATLRRLLNGIGKQALRYRYLAYSRAPQLMKLSLAGSRDILNAIVKGEPERAREITERLIRGSWQAIGHAIDEETAEAAERA